MRNYADICDKLSYEKTMNSRNGIGFLVLNQSKHLAVMHRRCRILNPVRELERNEAHSMSLENPMERRGLAVTVCGVAKELGHDGVTEAATTKRVLSHSAVKFTMCKSLYFNKNMLMRIKYF